MIQRYDFAPLDGITKVVFRQVWHRRFGGADRYFIPFFSPTDQHIVTKRDQRELDAANNPGLPLVPQIMTRRADDFLWAASLMEDLGYREVNLNLGCPSGTVTAKGKGSGFLARPEELERFFDEVFASVRLPVSVKTRLGVQSPEEFARLLEIYNRYPIACLTIHPRVRPELYKGTVHRDLFAWAVSESRIPLCYNGDLLTVEDITVVERDFPTVEAVMVGRGALGNPWVFRQINAYLTDSCTLIPPPGAAERIVVIKRHIDALCALKGEDRALREARKHVGWYLHGLRGAAQFRRRAGELCTLADLDQLLAHVYAANQGEG